MASEPQMFLKNIFTECIYVSTDIFVSHIIMKDYKVDVNPIVFIEDFTHLSMNGKLFRKCNTDRLLSDSVFSQ